MSTGAILSLLVKQFLFVKIFFRLNCRALEVIDEGRVILQLWLLLNGLRSEEFICLCRYRIDSCTSLIAALTFLFSLKHSLLLRGQIYGCLCLCERSWTY